MADDPVSARHEGIPDSTELLGGEHARRRRRMFIGLGAAAVLTVGGGIALVVLQDRAAQTRVREKAGDLSACLFGQAVPASEAPATKLRGAQLTAMGMSEPARVGQGKDPWPQRCGLVAQELMEASRDAGLASKDDDTDLVDRADAFAKLLKAPTGHFTDLSAAVDGTWAALAKAGIAVEARPIPAAPPPRATPLTAADLGAGSAISTVPFGFGGLGLSTYSGEVFHVLVQDAGIPKAPFVCAFTDGPVSCRSIPGELAKGQTKIALFGTAQRGAWPLLVAGEDGEKGLYRSDTGERIDDGSMLSASIAADGTVRVLRQSGAGLALATHAPGVSKPTLKRSDLPAGCTGDSASVLWDEAVVECRMKFDGNRADEWMLVPLGREVPGAKKKESEEGTEGGETPEDEAIVATMRRGVTRACRAGDTRVAGFGSSLFFFDGATWVKPQKSGLRGGGISCGDKVANVSFLADAGGDTPWRSEIGHTRCTVADCKSTQVDFERLLQGGLEGAPRGKLFDAAAAADAMIVAWASGQMGGVRVRIGAPDAILEARDVVVYDDLATEGELKGKPDLIDLAILGQPRQATLLLRSSRGVHAIRVTPDGGFAPAEIGWAGDP